MTELCRIIIYREPGGYALQVEEDIGWTRWPKVVRRYELGVLDVAGRPSWPHALRWASKALLAQASRMEKEGRRLPPSPQGGTAGGEVTTLNLDLRQ